jgi:hypothetical protein
MASYSTTSNLTSKPAVDETSPEASEQKARRLRLRVEAWLREIFEGHEEYLGCTPD